MPNLCANGTRWIGGASMYPGCDPAITHLRNGISGDSRLGRFQKLGPSKEQSPNEEWQEWDLSWTASHVLARTELILISIFSLEL